MIQKYIVADKGKELKLKGDCKTRWSSLEAMIERFLFVRCAIKKALYDLKIENMWNDEYVKIAEVLLATLKPVKLTVQNLSSKDSKTECQDNNDIENECVEVKELSLQQRLILSIAESTKECTPYSDKN